MIMKIIIKWFLLFTKRLYKKASFVIILALIPLVVLGLGIVAKQDSGFVTIALSQKDSTDKISNKIIDELTGDSGLLRFVEYDTSEEAIESVRYGNSDSAWILLDNMSERIKAFSSTKSADNAIAHVVEREQTVLLRISREKLSNVLYKYAAKDVYLSYTRTNVSALDQLSDDELLMYYDDFFATDELFEYAYPSSSGGGHVQQINYLIAPVRGLLSVLIVLGAMASAMFFMRDEKQGMFAWVPESRKIYVEFVCQIIAVINLCAVMLISICAVGLNVSLLRELAILVLYVISVALFGMLLRHLFNSAKILGALIPLFVTVMIAVCPVFFEFKEFRFLQMFFPPTYYINAVNNTNYIKYMVVYIAVCLVLIAAIKFIKKLQYQSILSKGNKKRQT